MTQLLKLEDVTFAFGDNQVLSNFNLTVNRNEIICIIGSSGRGKTTLLNLATGLLAPSRGAITLSTGIDQAYLTQSVTLIPYRKALENAIFGCELRKTLTDKKVYEANELFTKFKLSEETKHKFPHQLSGGMRQRVGLIQTMLIDANIYFLDEPFTGIDRSTALIIQDDIWRRFKNANSSSMIVTHNVEQAILIADKILILSDKHSDEIVFDRPFTELSPIERLASEDFSRYFLATVKKIGGV